MEPLDLSARPPRSGLEKLGGFYLLARTIDKIRAHLPGGNPGEYKIPGFSHNQELGAGPSAAPAGLAGDSRRRSALERARQY